MWFRNRVLRLELWCSIRLPGGEDAMRMRMVWRDLVTVVMVVLWMWIRIMWTEAKRGMKR